MSVTRRKFLSSALIGVPGLAVVVSACGSGDDGANGTSGGAEADPDKKVTISVMQLPPPDQKKQREAFLGRVETFQKENPNITVEPEETRFEPETFQAQLAGGTLPTVLHVPFTEPQGLIQRDQVADITAEFDQIEQFKSLNEDLLKYAQDADGHVYGIPVESYDLGLAYNREIFEAAGLNADDPPTTWADVRSAAKTINDKTGKIGYAQMTTDNTGGWMFTAMTYTFGGTVQEGGKASFNSPEGKQVLELLKQMRWEDDSMGKNILMNQAQLREQFAAGKIGMYIEAPGGLNPLANNFGFDPKNYGFGPMPQADGTAHGTLAGGAMAMIKPDATPEERLAGLKWIEYNYLGKYFDEELAFDLQKARADDGLPVGIPQLEPVSPKQAQKFDDVIKNIINIPIENFEPYISGRESIPLVAEPAIKAQETYTVLDSTMQGLLTKKDADVDQLLSDAENKVNTLIAGQ